MKISLKIKFIALAAFVVLMNQTQVFACAACYGESDAPMARGLTFAIIALAGIIACVLSGVVVFFVHLGKKSSTVVGEPATAAESVQRKS